MLAFLYWLAGVLVEIAVAIVPAIKDLAYLAEISAAIWLIYAILEGWHNPSYAQRAGHVVYNLTKGAIGIADSVIGELAPSLQAILQALVNGVQDSGPSLKPIIQGPVETFASGILNDAIANLGAAGESTAGNAVAQAADALAQAFGNGISSAGVTALFEAIFPEKLNVLNGVGPMLAQMAGFAEVTAQVRNPLYKAAFGASAEYKFNAQFTPYLPGVAEAAHWLSRGLITTAQFQIIYAASGLKAEYQQPLETASYRPIQPFMLSRLLQNEDFPTAAVQSALTFGGYRPEDIQFLLGALEWNSTSAVRQNYVNALTRSVELGTDTPQALSNALADLNYSQDAQNWVQLTVAETKLMQLAELYRKSVSEAYKYGQVTDANYVQSLEAIGIDSADAQAHYAIDSIAKNGKIAAAALRAAQALARRQTSAAMRTAIAEFQAGSLDAVSLEAALIAAGVDPVIAGYAVAYQEAKATGHNVFVYGMELPRRAAALLRAQVTALGTQVKAGLETPAAAAAQLAAWQIGQPTADALIANWAATKTPAADVGVKEPIQ